MWKYLSLLAVALALATASWSQDEDEDPADGQEQEEAAATDEAEGDVGDLDELPDDPELDDQGYEGDDDEFIPTEEIPVDQAIPFPTDI